MADTTVRSRTAVSHVPTLAFAIGLAFVASAAIGWSPLLLGPVALAVATWPLVAIDIAEHRLPNRIVLPCYPLALVGIACDALIGGASLLPAALGLAACLVGFLLMHVLGGMGMGDVKLAGLIGLCLGSLGATALLAGLLAAFVLGGVAGAWAMASQRRAATHRIPFGPFLLAGFWIGVAASSVAGNGVSGP